MSVDGNPAHQALARPLTDAEQLFADALVTIFGKNVHDFDAVAEALNEAGIARPSGAAGPWAKDVLEAELKAINLSLDESYDALSSGKNH